MCDVLQTSQRKRLRITGPIVVKARQGGKLAAQALLLESGGAHHAAAIQHHFWLAKLHDLARLAVEGIAAL